MKKIILASTLLFCLAFSANGFAQDTKTKEKTEKKSCCKSGDKKEKDCKSEDKKDCCKSDDKSEKKSCCKADKEKKAETKSTETK